MAAASSLLKFIAKQEDDVQRLLKKALSAGEIETIEDAKNLMPYTPPEFKHDKDWGKGQTVAGRQSLKEKEQAVQRHQENINSLKEKLKLAKESGNKEDIAKLHKAIDIETELEYKAKASPISMVKSDDYVKPKTLLETVEDELAKAKELKLNKTQQNKLAKLEKDITMAGVGLNFPGNSDKSKFNKKLEVAQNTLKGLLPKVKMPEVTPPPSKFNPDTLVSEYSKAQKLLGINEELKLGENRVKELEDRLASGNKDEYGWDRIPMNLEEEKKALESIKKQFENVKSLPTNGKLGLDEFVNYEMRRNYRDTGKLPGPEVEAEIRKEAQQALDEASKLTGGNQNKTSDKSDSLKAELVPVGTPPKKSKQELDTPDIIYGEGDVQDMTPAVINSGKPSTLNKSKDYVDAEFEDIPQKPIYQSGKSQPRLNPAAEPVYTPMPGEKEALNKNPSLRNKILGIGGGSSTAALGGAYLLPDEIKKEEEVKPNLTEAIKAESTKLPDTEQPDAVKQNIPTPEQAEDRKPLLDEADKISEEIQSIIDKPAYIPDFKPHLDKYLKVAGKQQEADIKPYLDTIQELKQQTDEIIKQKGKEVDRTEKLAMYEQLGQALSLIGNGLYGMKHNVDMSGVKFNPTDWTSQLDKRLALLDNRLSQYADLKKDALTGIKDAKQEAKDKTRLDTDIADKELSTNIREEEKKASALNTADSKKLQSLQHMLTNLSRKAEKDKAAEQKYKDADTREEKKEALAELKIKQKQEQALTQANSLINLYANNQIKLPDFNRELVKVTDNLPPEVAAMVTTRVQNIKPASKGTLGFGAREAEIPKELTDILKPGQTPPAGDIMMIRPDGAEVAVPSSNVEAAKSKGYKVK